MLLLDEPLSALDAHTRGVVRGELAELLAELRLPTLIVTHDFEDAAALADRVGVIVEGRILQLGAAAELLAAPADAFVASFTGANLLHGTARPGADGLTEVVLDTGGSAFSTDQAVGRVGLAVYPWEVSLARTEPADSAVNHLRGEVRSLVALGNRVRVRVGPLTAEVTAGSAERLALAEGEPRRRVLQGDGDAARAALAAPATTGGRARGDLSARPPELPVEGPAGREARQARRVAGAERDRVAARSAEAGGRKPVPRVDAAGARRDERREAAREREPVRDASPWRGSSGSSAVSSQIRKRA